MISFFVNRLLNDASSLYSNTIFTAHARFFHSFSSFVLFFSVVGLSSLCVVVRWFIKYIFPQKYYRLYEDGVTRRNFLFSMVALCNLAECMYILTLIVNIMMVAKNKYLITYLPPIPVMPNISLNPSIFFQINSTDFQYSRHTKPMLKISWGSKVQSNLNLKIATRKLNWTTIQIFCLSMNDSMASISSWTTLSNRGNWYTM